MKAFVSSIEILEVRIAPAAVFVSPTTTTYDDVDGDHVTVEFSKPILTDGNVATVVQVDGSGQLTLIDLTGVASAAQGTSLSVSAKLAGNGDGFVNVGRVNATGVDLGAVKIRGDLGQILAGSGTPSATALKSLSLQSLGRLAKLESDISGALGKLSVAGDIVGARVIVTGGADGKIGSVTIGGSLIGGKNSLSGAIRSTGDIGPVKIAGDVMGGGSPESGVIEAGGKLSSVTIGGSLVGGFNDQAGQITSGGDMGPVKIGHNVLGGGGTNSGRVSAGSKLGSVTIGGSLVGGPFDHSGEITSHNDMGRVKIGGNVQGGSGSSSGRINALGTLGGVTLGGSLLGGTGPTSGEILSTASMGSVKIAGDIVGGSISGGNSLDHSGDISCGGLLASLFVGGSILAGVNESSGILTNDASIAAGRIGPITVVGNVAGSIDHNGVQVTPVFITASGALNPGGDPNATKDAAIGKITIGGRVERAAILAGYDYANFSSPSPHDGDAQIGTVKIGGDWIASSLVAGVYNSGNSGTDFAHFGNGNDLLISNNGSPSIFAKIASITIGGQVIGSGFVTEHFGFVAEQIGSFKLAGAAIPLKNLAAGFRPLATTNDVAIHLV